MRDINGSSLTRSLALSLFRSWLTETMKLFGFGAAEVFDVISDWFSIFRMQEEVNSTEPVSTRGRTLRKSMKNVTISMRNVLNIVTREAAGSPGTINPVSPELSGRSSSDAFASGRSGRASERGLGDLFEPSLAFIKSIVDPSVPEDMIDEIHSFSIQPTQALVSHVREGPQGPDLHQPPPRTDHRRAGRDRLRLGWFVGL